VKGEMIIQTRAINPTSCSNCRGKISRGQTYYKAGRGEHGQLCIDCYEFQNIDDDLLKDRLFFKRKMTKDDFNNILKKVPTKCTKCGECCKFVSFKGDIVYLSKETGKRCKNLDENNLCKIYSIRLKGCRDFLNPTNLNFNYFLDNSFSVMNHTNYCMILKDIWDQIKLMRIERYPMSVPLTYDVFITVLDVEKDKEK
jgi:hypothetical protein